MNTELLTKIAQNASKAVVGFAVYNATQVAYEKLTEKINAKIETIENPKIKVVANVAYVLTGIVVCASASTIASNFVASAFDANEIEVLTTETFETKTE